MYNSQANHSKRLNGDKLPRVSCFRVLPSSALFLTKVISIFLESTDNKRLKFLTAVNLHLDSHYLHV